MDRRKFLSRRIAKDRRYARKKSAELIIDELRMQARTRASANRVMRVEPGDPTRMVEWRAADELEKIIKEL